MNPIKYASLFFREPSIWSGLTHVLDLSGGFRPDHDLGSDEEADALALAADWYAVGADLHRAIGNYAALVDQADVQDA